MLLVAGSIIYSVIMFHDLSEMWDNGLLGGVYWEIPIDAFFIKVENVNKTLTFRCYNILKYIF